MANRNERNERKSERRESGDETFNLVITAKVISIGQCIWKQCSSATCCREMFSYITNTHSISAAINGKNMPICMGWAEARERKKKHTVLRGFSHWKSADTCCLLATNQQPLPLIAQSFKMISISTRGKSQLTSTKSSAVFDQLTSPICVRLMLQGKLMLKMRWDEMRCVSFTSLRLPGTLNLTRLV